VAAAAGYVAWAALKDDTVEHARPGGSELRLATARKPFLVYQHVARDAHYAEVAVAPVDRPGAPPTFTGLVCERVYFAAARGLCLIPKQEALGSAARARVFGLDFRPLRTARLDGIVSRARVSPSGRFGASTTFVTGHSYQDAGFSTSTSLIDMERGKVLANLEDFDVTRNGKAFDAIDFNFWGVTFTRDDRRFYATLQTSGDIYLVEGDVETRKARVIDKGVECPSLSPDERRIAFKKRRGNRWRLSVLELASGRETPLAETRSVDDQVEWLDDSRILYGLAGDLWVVQADGGGRPRLYLEDALSPAVVRS
jgi:dipeptidyl aminopeptidase/acylaminoacyl peptidase